MISRENSLDQSGMVSIVVTMIIMVILSLIVIGFARISRREQRQGLDRQLASQAYYAAESGINDAQTYLKAGGTLSSTASTACNTYAADNGNALPVGKTEQVGSNNVTTSCVLVNNSVTQLVYDGVGTDEEVVFPVKSSNGGVINNLYISWQAPGQDASQYNSTNCPPRSPSSNALVPLADWKCPAGTLRIDIVPIQSSFTRDDLINNSVGGLLYPKIKTTGASSNSEHLNNGNQVWAECPNDGSSTYSCRVTLANIGSSDGYYVRIRPVYRAADIYIQGLNGNVASVLTGAQAVVDSTGRANDVLKRLVVRIPTCPTGVTCGKQPAGYALQLADTLCKQYGIIPPSTVNAENSDPACALP
ncbi:hypothetical protein KC957_02575 [Candidatus Saccharibacteria bacterium]|nr:hypothetical protein [Candidatus Saccharibacteria bacterium]